MVSVNIDFDVRTVQWVTVIRTRLVFDHSKVKSSTIYLKTDL